MILIKDSKKKIACIINFRTIKKNSINFLTSPGDEFQLAKISREKNHKIKPHYHPKRLKKIYMTSEVLIILKGRIKVNFFNDKLKFIKSKIVKSGQLITFFAGGHGFEFLTRTNMIEIKQGPYKKNLDKNFVK